MIQEPKSDPEGYFRVCHFLINQYARYLRTPISSPKTKHSLNQELYQFELTVDFINPYTTRKQSLKPMLDILAEYAESDQSKPDIWRGDTDVRIAKLNLLAYQHPYFLEIPEHLQDNVRKILREKFPSVLKHPPSQRCEDIDPLLNRLWMPDFEI